MASKRPIIPEIIGDIIDSMRYTGTITLSVETSGLYTLTSVNTLTSNEVVSINSIDYVVTVIDENSFTIEAETGLDFTGLSWKALAPYYEYGTPKEVSNTLSKKINDIFVHQKYPLIWLLIDIKSSYTISGYTAPLDIVICNYTVPTYKAAERTEKNFEPILYPLLDRFERAVIDSKLVSVLSPEYSQIDHYYWGKEGIYGHDGNIFNDHIDAIEINDFNMKFNNLKC